MDDIYINEETTQEKTIMNRNSIDEALSDDEEEFEVFVGAPSELELKLRTNFLRSLSKSSNSTGGDIVTECDNNQLIQQQSNGDNQEQRGSLIDLDAVNMSLTQFAHDSSQQSVIDFEHAGASVTPVESQAISPPRSMSPVENRLQSPSNHKNESLICHQSSTNAEAAEKTTESDAQFIQDKDELQSVVAVPSVDQESATAVSTDIIESIAEADQPLSTAEADQPLSTIESRKVITASRIPAPLVTNGAIACTKRKTVQVINRKRPSTMSTRDESSSSKRPLTDTVNH